ncbi:MULTISPECIES: SDR family oxidoreductase [Atopobiaceae]|uniref:SDR family oxidoreductase n=1 Tax=Atopobiaceae TaxID=1643824 RepID=UPI003515726B
MSGGTGGIGSVIVRDLVDLGCLVVVAGRSREKFETLFADLPQDRLTWVDFDAARAIDDGIRYTCEAARCFGRMPTLWVLSAGVHSENRKLSFMNATRDDYESVVSLDFDSTCEMALSAANAMAEEGLPGRIVIVSSSTGGESSWSPYRVAKRACNAFARQVSDELKRDNIGIWCVCPGPTATKMLHYKDGSPINTHDIQAGRLVMPEEVSSLVNELLLRKELFCTGESLFLSGGRGTFDCH